MKYGKPQIQSTVELKGSLTNLPPRRRGSGKVGHPA